MCSGGGRCSGRRQHHASATPIATHTAPPTTPPMMAPVELVEAAAAGDAAESEVRVVVHEVDVAEEQRMEGDVESSDAPGAAAATTVAMSAGALAVTAALDTPEPAAAKVSVSDVFDAVCSARTWASSSRRAVVGQMVAPAAFAMLKSVTTADDPEPPVSVRSDALMVDASEAMAAGDEMSDAGTLLTLYANCTTATQADEPVEPDGDDVPEGHEAHALLLRLRNSLAGQDLAVVEPVAHAVAAVCVLQLSVEQVKTLRFSASALAMKAVLAPSALVDVAAIMPPASTMSRTVDGRPTGR